MNFQNDKAIYIQIAEFVMGKILRNEWVTDSKILSVRDLGAALEVNPNTVMRAYDLLQNQNIIFNKRGLGFYVAEQARELIIQLKRKQFLEVELPGVFVSMDLLGISIEEIIENYKTRL